MCVVQGSLMASEGEQADELGEEEESGAVVGAANEDGAFGSMPTEEQLPGMQQANTTKYAHCKSPHSFHEHTTNTLTGCVRQGLCVKVELKSYVLLATLVVTSICSAACFHSSPLTLLALLYI